MLKSDTLRNSMTLLILMINTTQAWVLDMIVIVTNKTNDVLHFVTYSHLLNIESCLIFYTIIAV